VEITQAAVYFCKVTLQDVLSGLAGLGIEPADGARRAHPGVLGLPMQREESRRIAKLYEFTGKAGLGSIVWAGFVEGRGRELQVSPLCATG
jgi:hypothetical protein